MNCRYYEKENCLIKRKSVYLSVHTTVLYIPVTMKVYFGVSNYAIFAPITNERSVVG